MKNKPRLFLLLSLFILIGVGVFIPQAVHAEIMVVGIDRKVAFDANAVRQTLEPGHDEVMFFDVSDAEAPKLIGSVDLENSVLGPPTNVAISPDQSMALIANAVHSEKTETGWKTAPADEVFVVDLKSSPPRLVQTLKVGRQPSGLSISQDGRLALVVNRDSKSITSLLIDHSTVTVGETVATEDSLSAVAITPDGKRAIATKTTVHKVVVLNIGEDRKITLGSNISTGLYPWNVSISPDGRRALVNNIGNGMAQSDGNAKTVSVLDLAAPEPHVSSQVSVGDGPEGVVFSPDSKYAAITVLGGSYGVPSTAWFRHDAGSVSLISFSESTPLVSSSIAVRAFPEGLAFSADSRHIYAGNFHSNSISILKVDDRGHLIDTGKTIGLPGPPASLRIGSQ